MSRKKVILDFEKITKIKDYTNLLFVICLVRALFENKMLLWCLKRKEIVYFEKFYYKLFSIGFMVPGVAQNISSTLVYNKIERLKNILILYF